MVIRRPLTDEQKKYLANKSKPSQEAINAANEKLMNYITLKLLELEDKANGTIPALQSK